MNTFKRLCAVVLTVTLLPVSSLAAPAAESFSDVPANAWYANAVQTCLETGLMTGRGDGKFAPTAAVTYAEAAAMAARVYSLTHGDNGEVPPAKDGERWWAGAARYLDESGALAPIKDVKPKEEYYHFLDNENGSLLDALSYYPALNMPEDELQWWLNDEDSFWLYTRFADNTSPRLFFLLLAACAMPEDQLAGDAGMSSLPDYRPELDAYSPVYAELVLRLYNAGVLTGGDEWGTVNYSDPLTRAEAAALLVRLTDETKRVSAPLKALPGTLEPLDAGFMYSLYDTYTYDESACGSLDRTILYDLDGMTEMLTNGVIVPAQKEHDQPYGYRDVHGNWVIEPRFERAEPFGDFPIARVVEDGAWALIDKTGRTIQTFGMVDKYYVVNLHLLSANVVFLEGRDASGYSTGLYRADGTAILPLSSRSHISNDAFSDGLLWVSDAESGLYGAIDETGKWVIPCSYQYAFPFYEGRAAVILPDNSRRIIDKSGRTLIENFAPDLSLCDGDFGLFEVCPKEDRSLRGVIDSYGRILVPTSYDMINLLSPDSIFARIADPAAPWDYSLGQHFYFDRSGKQLAEAPEDESEDSRFVLPQKGPYDLRRKGSNFAFFSTDGAQLTPYLFYGEPLYLPKLKRYIVRIHEASYLYFPAA